MKQEKDSHSKTSTIKLKLVYFGPPGSGKATNLQRIYKSIHPYRKGELKYTHLDMDQMIELNFEAKVGRVLARIKIVTLTGNINDPQALTDIIYGLNGLVMVMDSNPKSGDANSKSLELLSKSLSTYKVSLESVPIVIQYNKRDIPDALPLEEMERVINRFGAPFKESVATEGKGVDDSLISITAKVLDSLSFEKTEPERSDEWAEEEEETVAEEEEVEEEEESRSWLEKRFFRRRAGTDSSAELLKREQRKIVKKRKAQAENCLKMAELFLNLDDYEESSRWSRELLQLEPDNQKGKEILKQAQERLDEKIDSLYHESMKLMEGRNFLAAQEKLEMVLDFHPEHREARALLDVAKKKMARTQEIQKARIPAKKTSPAPAKVQRPQPQDEKKIRVMDLLRESEQLYKKEDYDGTIKVLSRVHELAPDLKRGSELLDAVIRKKKETIDEMFRDARRAFREKKYEDSLRTLNRVLSQDPENETALELLEKASTAILQSPGSPDQDQSVFEEDLPKFFERATVDMIEDSLNILKPRPKPKAEKTHREKPLTNAPDVETIRKIDEDLGFLKEHQKEKDYRTGKKP